MKITEELKQKLGIIISDTTTNESEKRYSILGLMQELVKPVGVHDIEEFYKEDDLTKFIPYQLCPKCSGQGIVSKPPGVAGDVDQWISGETVHNCDVCKGKKIIPMCKI